MSSAIEVLKKLKEDMSRVCVNENLDIDERIDNALGVALLALQSQELLQKRNAFLQEQKDKQEEDIKCARRCLEFSFRHCENNDCLNESCPLNKKWKKVLGEKPPAEGEQNE